MDDTNISYQYSYIESKYLLDEHCSDSSVNDTVFCKEKEMILFFLKADFYTNRAFYPLTTILIVIGTILNLFSLYYFLKISKRNSQNIYLSVLSLSDTINLHMNFTLPILRQSTRFDDYFRKSTILCRLTGLLTEFFLIFPIWIVILLIIECLIYISWSVQRRSLYAKRRAKISIIILAIIVGSLSLYRLFDFKGIDQFSVFSVIACSSTNTTIVLIRNFNLVIWIIVPECFTLIMSLIIIYSIKLDRKKSRLNYSNVHRLKFNQITKTVLFISILILILHTPTGIIVALDFIYGDNHEILVIVILLTRKLTIILYQISLSCKFFIYNRTFRNFKGIFQRSMLRFTHRTNSAELGRPFCEYLQDCSTQRTIRFGQTQRLITYPENRNDSLITSSEEHQNILNNCRQQTNRGYRRLTVIMTKTNDDAHVLLLS